MLRRTGASSGYRRSDSEQVQKQKKMKIRGKKGDSEEMAPSAIIGLILSAIFIIFVALVLFNIWFGGFASPEQKARIALLEMAEAIPDSLSDEEFKGFKINLPSGYIITAEPLCNNLTNLSLYTERNNIPSIHIDSVLVKADNVIRGHLNGRECTENTRNEECLKHPDKSRIYCEDFLERGSGLGIQTTYCMYTAKMEGGKYALLYKHDCMLNHGDISSRADECHKFGEECSGE